MNLPIKYENNNIMYYVPTSCAYYVKVNLKYQ